LFFQWLDDWGCDVTTKVKPEDCVAGKWYHREGWGRVLACGTTGGDKIPAFAVRVGATTQMRYFYDEFLTHLPDCTGWDWQPPPPKYRPFKDAWEFLDAIRGRKVLVNGNLNQVELVDLREGETTAYLTGQGWKCFDFVLENCTFSDTGEPCGVRCD
jgi:hypothetical protein